MQATHGFATLFRPRTYLLACLTAAVTALAGLAFTSSASAGPPHESYVGLGDSLAFGYSQQLFNENEAKHDQPTAFEHGYVNDYLNKLTPGVQLVNQGCPGETTDSFIGNGPLGKQMAEKFGTTDEAACAYKYADKLKLHHEYGGSQSQLESTLEVIRNLGGNPAKTVSLNIGANDELHQVARCEAEVKSEFEKTGKSKYGGKTPEEAVKFCIVSHAIPLFTHIITNITGILYVIRHGSQFCVPAGSHCTPPGGAGVDYTGKLIFQGGYNPFGAVFVPGMELLPGSNGLVNFLNTLEKLKVEEFGGCFANPHPRFNPENSEEPERLQKFTNMANFTKFEGKKNGPDIHPTPLGYEELASIMKAQCP